MPLPGGGQTCLSARPGSLKQRIIPKLPVPLGQCEIRLNLRHRRSPGRSFRDGKTVPESHLFRGGRGQFSCNPLYSFFQNNFARRVTRIIFMSLTPRVTSTGLNGGWQPVLFLKSHILCQANGYPLPAVHLPLQYTQYTKRAG